MIPIKMQPEPSHFYEKVQKKGEKFLAQHPEAKGSALEAYWRSIIPDLYTAYSKICAYSCHWIPEDTGWNTVEHFRPKDLYPEEAYCWANYRLVCGRLNGRKGIHEDVLDPFTLQEGWFTIHFPSLQLIPGRHLAKDDVQKVKQTIDRLNLNDATCIDSRKGWLESYLLKRCNIQLLEERAPFLAKELNRQELTDMNHPMWDAFRKYAKIS